MATPQDIEQQLRRIQSLYDKLGESNPFAGVDANAIASSTKEVGKLQVALDGVQSRVDNLDQTFSSLTKQLTSTIQEIKKGPDATKRLADGFKGVLNEVKKLTYEEEGINRLSITQLESIKEIALKRAADAKAAAKELVDKYKLERDALPTLKEKLEFYNKQTDATKNALIYIRDENETLQAINDKLDARIKKEKQINENLGISGALLKGAGGLMDKFGLGALSSAIGFGKINEELAKYANELEDSNSNLSNAEKKQMVMRKGFSLLGESIKESLNDPLVVLGLALKGLNAIVGLVADGFKRSQENTSSLAKNLNINNREAMQLSKNMSAASFGSDRLFVSSKGLTETLVAINSELGTTVQLSAEELLTFTKLRETAGLTNAELMGIQKLSLANGASFDDNADSILNQVSALNKSSGIYLNEKEVLKDISKLSAATTLSLGKNPKALGEAVATAKSLGMEMAKVDQIAGSLMEFESSITSELEAELLLGRDINLEKARQAALNNDLATLAKEIAEQAGTAEEFGRMNRIQQEAIAKAVGMNREDLAQTLFVQEQLAGASGEEAERRQKLLDARIEEVGLAQAQRELEEGGLQNMLDQATASDKMRASQEKILEIFTSIGAAFAPVVDMFAAVVGAIVESKAGMAVLAGLITGVSAALAVMAVRSVITAVASIFKGSMALGPLGIPLAIGGVAALIGGIAAAMSATKAGDVMSPADGKTQISTKEGGLFELSKNDDLVAAPGAVEKMKNGGSTTVVQQAPPPPDNTEAKRTNQLLEKLANQPSVFKIGTDEFFTSTAKYSYQVQ